VPLSCALSKRASSTQRTRLFKQNVKTLRGQILEAMEARDFLFWVSPRMLCSWREASTRPKMSISKAFLIFSLPRHLHLLFEKNLSFENWSPLLNALQERSRARETKSSGSAAGKHQAPERWDHQLQHFLHRSCVAAHLSPAGDDNAMWRQLILQPAGIGNFNLDSRE